MNKFKILLVCFLTAHVIYSQQVPKHLNELYNKIYNSMTSGTIIKPKLVVIDDLKLDRDKQIIAVYSPLDKTITVGSSFLKLTSKFSNDSSNARAHVLCHELAHLFLNHGYASIIGTGFASAKINKQLKESKKGIEDNIGELEAEQWAYFYAYCSGFKTKGITPVLLDSIYKYYKLTDDKLSNYPKLIERKKIANDASYKMNSMCDAFDFANMASIHGDYDLSAEIYNAIIQEGFKSREIVSNIGTAYLLKAISLMDTSETKFRLPLQIDMNTRMRQEDVRGITIDDEINELLSNAINLFKDAIRIDEDYGIAYLNLSIAYWLHKETDADYYLQKAKNKLSILEQDKALLFEAIMMYHSNEKQKKEQGLSTLTKMAADANKLAKANLTDINTKSNTIVTPEYINEIASIKIPNQYDFSKINILDPIFKKSPKLYCNEISAKFISRKWKLANQKYGGYLIVIQHLFNQTKTISENDKNNLIASSQSIFETNTGTYLRFNDIIVIINSNNQATYQILKKQ